MLQKLKKHIQSNSIWNNHVSEGIQYAKSSCVLNGTCKLQGAKCLRLDASSKRVR